VNGTVNRIGVEASACILKKSTSSSATKQIFMLLKRKIASVFLLGMFVIGGVVSAQQQMMPQQQQQKNYSEDEIDLFAEAVIGVLPIQQEAEQKMVSEIEEQGMELDQFNQIARQMQQGVESEGVQEDDMQAFQSISEEIQGIQMETQQEVNQVITETGISPAMYQEMIAAYSSNPQIKQKVDQKLAEQQQQ
jgi:hypothetical protein